MAKKYRLNIDTGVLHIIGFCYQAETSLTHSRDYDTEDEAYLDFGRKVHPCIICQRKKEKKLEG